MIFILNKEAKLDNVNGNYIIYNWERVIISPFQRKLIKLPYKIANINKFINFELSKSLSINGLQLLHHNLNDKETNQLEFLVWNTNFDFNMLNGYQNAPLQSIVGSNEKIDIKSNIEFGKIYL